ncbi:carboxylesterase [Bifidobacterium goeldii]|uniref:Carboxylic ester hydrolase n=1 Tax=Bifidobacterium goeldii TaxID=2306975 RepID=A0A430FNH4_9BIFI|nr:carboxylesterase family protein [Bifidobacterium goeldii]RSX54364.1 carboxylesterase [Bifidobacterium goeldii]
MAKSIAHTVAGDIEGIASNGLLQFLGVPYAAPLNADNRFAPPQPVEHWAEVLPCVEPGPAAWQVSAGGFIGASAVSPRPQGAACLNLNVRTTSLDGQRPVFVWFHGGGLFGGSNYEPDVLTHAFADEGIVEVTCNYRLGVYGYCDMGNGSNPNRGTLDQIAALEWVRDNIASFGGDPHNVTIGGHSAGGFSCAELLASPKAQGLFHKVFLASGSCSARHGARTAEQISRVTFDALGIDPDLAPADRLHRLAALSDQAILAGQRQIIEDCYVNHSPQYGEADILGLAYEHTIDDSIIVHDVPAVLASAARQNIPVLVGTTTGECRAHASKLPDTFTDADVAKLYRPWMAPWGIDAQALTAAYREFFPEADSRGIASMINGDLRFNLDSLRVALAQKHHAGTWRFVIGDYDEHGIGLTPHGAVQGHAWRGRDGNPAGLKPNKTPFNRDTADYVHNAVTAFIRTGNPSNSTADWHAQAELRDDHVLWVRAQGDTVAASIITDPLYQRWQWWHEQLPERFSVSSEH